MNYCGKWGRCEILGDSFAWGMSQARQRSGQSPRRKSEKSFSRAELKISRIKKANRWFQGKKSEAFFNAKIFFRPLKILRKSKILVQYESFSPNINSWKGTLNLTMPDTGGLTIMGQNWWEKCTVSLGTAAQKLRISGNSLRRVSSDLNCR